jgi:tetratricopeptide (TPR) repeat protein
MGTQDRGNRGTEVNSLGRAFNYYVNARDIERAVATSLSAQIGSGRILIETALTLVSPDSLDAGRLQSRHILTLRADYDRSQEAFEQALSIARQQQDKVLEMQALVAAACVDLTSNHFERSLERNQQALDLAQLVDLPIEEAHVHFDLYHVLYAMGDLEGATRHAEAMLEPAERTRTRIWRDRAMDSNHTVSGAKGDWRTAKRYLEQGLATSPQDYLLIGAGAVMEYQLGEIEAGEDYLKRLLDGIPERGDNLPGPFATLKAVVIPMVAYITGGMDKLDVAERVARSIFDSPEPILSHMNAARIGLALIAVLRSDIPAATESYDSLQPLLGTMAPQSNYGPGVAVDRVLGLLSQTTGKLDQASNHFEDALTFCRKGGYRPELAWTCCDYADTLRERDSEGDLAKAIALLDESLAISSDLGMRPLMERVLSRREILKA